MFGLNEENNKGKQTKGETKSVSKLSARILTSGKSLLVSCSLKLVPTYPEVSGLRQIYTKIFNYIGLCSFFIIFSFFLHSNLMNKAAWKICMKRYFIGVAEYAINYSEDMDWGVHKHILDVIPALNYSSNLMLQLRKALLPSV